MKQHMLALGFALGFALGACGGGGKPSTTPPSNTSEPGTGQEPPKTGCAREIAIRCANGVDGCDVGKTTEHVCVPADAKVGPACELELALVCPEGQVDGCLRSPPVSKHHVCVYE